MSDVPLRTDEQNCPTCGLRDCCCDDMGDEEWACTWCGGEGTQENDDPLWYGHAYAIPCECCGGTGMRKHQTVF